MAITAIISFTNMWRGEPLELRRHREPDKPCNFCVAESSQTVWRAVEPDPDGGPPNCCDMWVPWCQSAKDFADGHYLTVGIKDRAPLYWIWQERQADGDYVRCSTAGAYENPAAPISGSAAVRGNRDCGLTVNGDRSLLLWDPDPAVEIPWFPGNLYEDHRHWHMDHMKEDARTQSGRQFLEFHRDFLARFHEWYDRQHWANPSLVAPWPVLPPEFDQHEDPEARRWFDVVHDLETNLYKWRDDHHFGTHIQFGGLHAWMHHVPITTVYRDTRITNFTTSPTSRYFYQLHGLIDSWWRRWSDGRAAIVLAQSSVPSSVLVGQRFDVAVTVRNTGRFSWPAGGANPVRLGSEDPQDNSTWGSARINLTMEVASQAEHTFDIHATAPAAPGRYLFRWRMVQEGLGWFGQLTPLVAIDVVKPKDKEGKDHKEGKDIAKEKDFAKEKDMTKEKEHGKERDAFIVGPPFVSGEPGVLAADADDTEDAARGRPFIRPVQRPDVGPAKPANSD